MKAVLFAAGSRYSEIVFEELAKRGLVQAVVVPAPRGSGWKRFVRGLLIAWTGRRFRVAIRRVGVPVIHFRGPEDVGHLTAESFCVAAFPYLLGPHIRSQAQAVLNVHPSLLPRHRGGDPIFWTYFDDDRECGVTVHLLDDGVDSGPVVAQEQMTLQRGQDSASLTEQLARRGGVLLAGVLEKPLQTQTQDEALATTEKLPGQGGWKIDWDRWSGERVWHFLRGVGKTHGHQLKDRLENSHPVGEALHFIAASHGRPPGTIESHRGGHTIYCVDGIVEAHPASFLRRVLGLWARLTPPRDSSTTGRIRS